MAFLRGLIRRLGCASPKGLSSQGPCQVLAKVAQGNASVDTASATAELVPGARTMKS
jgi:hypothetical protein